MRKFKAGQHVWVRRGDLWFHAYMTGDAGGATVRVRLHGQWNGSYELRDDVRSDESMAKALLTE